MEVVALVLALLTAAGGATLFATWWRRGGSHRSGRGRLPLTGILGHAGVDVLAIVALAAWVGGAPQGVGVVSAGLFVLAAAGGLAMFAGWLEERQETPGVTSGSATPRGQLDTRASAEVKLPAVIVAAHGAFAVATIVVVLVAVLS